MSVNRDMAALIANRRRHHILVGKGTQTPITHIDIKEKNLRHRATQYSNVPTRTLTKYWVDPNDPWVLMINHFDLIRGMDDDDLAKQLEIEKVLATHMVPDDPTSGWDAESDNRIYAVIEEMQRRAGLEV